MKEIDYLGKDYLKIIEMLSKKAYYVREMASEAGIAPSFAHKILSNLEKKKIAIAKSTRNLKYFSLNFDSPIAKAIIRLILVGKVSNSNAFKAIRSLNPKAIYLYGSAASGEISAESDIDIAILFDRAPNAVELSKAKMALSNELKADIQMVTLTKESVASMKKNKSQLLEELINKSVVLEGEPIE